MTSAVSGKLTESTRHGPAAERLREEVQDAHDARKQDHPAQRARGSGARAPRPSSWSRRPMPAGSRPLLCASAMAMASKTA